MNRPSRRRGGFTLIEVMLVLVILVVLVSLVVATYSRTQRTALRRAARVQIGLLEKAVQEYQLEVRNLPPDLQALIERPSDLPNPARWQGPYLEKSIPLDPWDHEYRYEVDAASGTITIRSAGPDGVEGNDDDISNYDQE